jgi:hypothetical protein
MGEWGEFGYCISRRRWGGFWPTEVQKPVKGLCVLALTFSRRTVAIFGCDDSGPRFQSPARGTKNKNAAERPRAIPEQKWLHKYNTVRKSGVFSLVFLVKRSGGPGENWGARSTCLAFETYCFQLSFSRPIFRNAATSQKIEPVESSRPHPAVVCLRAVVSKYWIESPRGWGV